MSYGLEDWLLCQEFTLNEVSQLLAGWDPYHQYTDEFEVEAYKSLESKIALYERILLKEAEAGRLGIRLAPDEANIYDRFSFGKDEIVQWANGVGLEFPRGCRADSNKQTNHQTSIDDLIYPDNPYLSHKLKVVINVWLELVENGTNGKTPKQATEDIIGSKYPGTTDVKELVKIINWYPDGRRVFPPLKDYEE